MDWKERIAVSPDVMGGKPVIRGTRVPIETIIGALAGGDSVADVCEGYGVAEEDVRAALTYAAEMLGMERLYALPGR